MHTDRFTPLDAATLLRWMQHDLPNKQLFGIGRELFFMPKPDDPFRMERYGKVLETPLGVAAGPHTQLAQNILSAWLCGARYIELKTVQVLDELNVAKPCIDMADEGYNCEWSQELKLDQSFEEYLKAFVLLYVLRDMLNLPVEADPGKGPGFIFNMSAGYNLEGIKSPAVQRFLDRMENAEEDVKRIKAELAQLYPAIEKMPIPARLSDNLTVSTMHGCPPDEVESIGRYFITERRYHTTIKLNPTLLGPERLRDILNTQLGYDVCVPDEAFGHDLKYNDGVAIIRNLAAAAETAGVAFGLKLTNTLETANEKQNLPRSEGMVYMSGRSLHPISINLAERLQQEFDGKLDIAFSAGVDTFNVADTLACGLRPITMSSDILKPGGYGRLHQYLDTLRAEMRKAGAHTIAEWEKSRSPIAGNPGFANLVSYAAAVLGKHSRYHKERFPYVSVKTERPLPRFDCAAAPCMSGCPAEQDIPRYLDAVARGDFELAWRVITATNPFPNVQGMACNHQCQSRCTRINYDKPLMIREVKRFVAEKMAEAASGVPAAQTGKRAAVIGAGPAGLSCARFLAAQGVEVHLYEEKPVLGGMAGDAIPAFRLTGDSLRRDIDAILKLGVRLHKDTPVDAALFDAFDYVALGHLHSPQKVGRETLRYCGTPLKYSFSEAGQCKSATFVELGAKGEVHITTAPLTPRHELRGLRGSYMELTDRRCYEGTAVDDYLYITLTDEQDVPDALARLRVIYPNLMQLDYDNQRTCQQQEICAPERTESISPLEHLAAFYQLQNNQPLTAEQTAFCQELIEEIWKEGDTV